MYSLFFLLCENLQKSHSHMKPQSYLGLHQCSSYMSFAITYLHISCCKPLLLFTLRCTVSLLEKKPLLPLRQSVKFLTNLCFQSLVSYSVLIQFILVFSHSLLTIKFQFSHCPLFILSSSKFVCFCILHQSCLTITAGTVHVGDWVLVCTSFGGSWGL